MRWIDEIIVGLEEVYDTSDVYELYDSLDISIVYLDEWNILLQGHDAVYNRSYLDQETVFIKKGLPIVYERFILAHELGHGILHTDIAKSVFNPLANLNKLEKQANYFAVKLLGFRVDSIAFEGFTVEQIASTLEVPMRCMEIIREVEGRYTTKS